MTPRIAVLPGDVIWVPTKPERNAWGTVRDIFSATATATAIVLSVIAVAK